MSGAYPGMGEERARSAARAARAQRAVVHRAIGLGLALQTQRGGPLAPADAARLLNARFPSPLVLSSSRTRKLPDTLSRLGIAGGAVYDALVALAAKEHGAALATRDARARGTYDAVGVEVIVVT
jgi:predicted nucleic acid-binding protein